MLGIVLCGGQSLRMGMDKGLMTYGGQFWAALAMQKLHELGIIKGSHLIIDPQKAGYDICAFLGIYLEKGIQYKDAVAQLSKIKEVVELHYTTGAYSMFAKIICRDTSHLRHVLNEEIQAVSGIQRTETLISLEESIKRQIELS